MNIYGKALLVSLGIAASTFVSVAPASAQYYGRGYERSDRYDRGNLQAQKQAIRAQREAQKRAMRGAPYGGRGYGQDYVGRGRAYGGNNGPTGGGFVIAPGPAGGYAVPVMPGNAGRYGNPNN